MFEIGSRMSLVEIFQQFEIVHIDAHLVLRLHRYEEFAFGVAALLAEDGLPLQKSIGLCS
jgi:hypothetical protein